MNTSMNQTSNNPQDSGLPTPNRPVWPAVLGAGLALLGGATFYQNSQTQELQKQLTASQQEASTLRTQMGDARANLTTDIQALKDSLEQQLTAAKADVNKVRVVAVRHADTLAKKQSVQNEQLAAELGKVKESTTETATKIDDISTAFGSTKTDLDATRTELAGAKTEIADTRSDLQRVRGDMGMMGGLVATNSKDIQYLRELGDRNIFEFNIAKAGGMQKVGDIQLALRKTDPRHNRFTVEVLADDKLVQKRDKNTNEPVQFYTSKSRQVYEVVVNRVDKDRIVGYLATPRMTLSRNEPVR